MVGRHGRGQSCPSRAVPSIVHRAMCERHFRDGPNTPQRSAGTPRRLGRVGAGTYEAAGVSLASAGAVVDRLRAAVESTGAEGFGAFAGLYPLDDRRLLAASTDSVGTKLVLARERGRLRHCGRDLAAHCVNDVL